MKLTIKYDIDLSNDDIIFLRMFLDKGIDNPINKILLDIKFDYKLVRLGLVSVDNLFNIKLTELGKIVVDNFDRNKKIDNLLK